MSRRLLAALAALLVIAAAAFAINRWVLDEDRTEVVALFDSTVGLYPGSDVQVLGVPVGTVTKVEPKDDHVRVTMELDPGQQVAADTGAEIGRASWRERVCQVRVDLGGCRLIKQ